MDHGYIEEQALIERYFRGDLPAVEEAAFEQHFFACERCQGELEVAREMGRGLKAVAAQQAVRPAVVSGAVLGWLARRSALQLGLLAATLLAALALPLLVFYGQQRELDEQLLAAHSTTQELRQDLVDERQRANQASQRLVVSASDWQAQRQQLEEKLKELAASESPATGLSQPLVDAAVYLLAAMRDSAARPVVVVRRPSAAEGAFSLAVDVGAAAYDSYRVTIVDGDGERRFERAGLKLNVLEVVMVTFPARFLSPGDYRLELAGREPGGKLTVLASHRFRVAGDS